jgi:GT2 family glycosyltransferase
MFKSSKPTAAQSNLPLVGIVIPYFRAPEKLQACLAAIQAQEGVQTEVYVRDNSENNILFTRAVNEGLMQFCFSGRHDYVLVLNQDAYLRPSCLSKLVQSMQLLPKVGIACPIQLSSDNQPSWTGSLDAFPAGIHARSSLHPLPSPSPTYWANGACMLLRSAMVREIGVLDKNMRFICSDSDYSFTARSRGWEVLVVPSAQVEHSLDSSGTLGSDWLVQVKLQDVQHFIHKWLNGNLYRQLAFEGPTLTPEFVQNHLNQVVQTIELLGHRMAAQGADNAP